MSETLDGKTVTELMDLPYVYLHSTSKLIKGKPWGRLNVGQYSQTIGDGLSSNGDGDPSRWIDFLKATGQARAVGMETVRGVRTAHYHALIDYSRFPAVAPSQLRAAARQEAALLERISGQSSLPIDAWVDGQGRLRRYQVRVPLCYQGDARASP